MSEMRYSFVVKRSFVRCMVPGEDIISRRVAGERSARSKKKIRCRFLGITRNDTWSVEHKNKTCPEKEADCGEELFEKKLLPTWRYFLGTFMELRRVQGVSCYLVLIFEPLQSQHLEISNLVNKCAVNYTSSDRRRTEEV